MIIVKQKNQEQRILFPKHIDNGLTIHTLYLHSELTNNDYEFEVADDDMLTTYYVFDILFEDVEDGEYVYNIDNISKGLIQIGDIVTNKTEYNKNENIIFYGE